jgi:hypothetical protein
MNLSKHRSKKAFELMKQKPIPFEQIDLSKCNFIPKGMTRAFKNNTYTVMIFDETSTTKGNAIKAMVQKHNNTPIFNHWSELQNIKNEIFGDETTAIEYYPPESKLVNLHNIYWLWIFPNNILPIPS